MTGVETNPRELLREAAGLMRERAEVAAPSPWEDDRTPGRGFGAAVWHTKESGHDAILAGAMRHEDATHIASWHPEAAIAAADLLDEIAEDVGTASFAFKAAEKFARAYLGSER